MLPPFYLSLQHTEAEKVERLRVAEASSTSVRSREPPELDEPRLVGMKREPETGEPHLEVCKELLCFVPCMDGCAGRPAEGRRCKSVTVKAQRATPTPSHARAVVRLQAKR